MACVIVAAPAWGQDQLREAEQALSDTRQDLKQQFGHLDWERQRENIKHALETIWTDNQWTNESDRFAFEVARDTSAIPPWQPMQRIDLMVDRFRQRYQISEEAAAPFKRKVILEAGGFMGRHAATLFKQARASIGLTGGDGFMTPEQVAAMVEEIEPLRADALAMVDRLIVEIEGIAPESAKETIQRDLRSFRKRETHLDRMFARWKRGEWEARDWGLPDDRNSARPANGERIGGATDGKGESASDARANRLVTTCLAHDPSTWFVCVRDFQKRYKLDAAQVTAARSIESELVLRAMTYRESHKTELDEVPPSDRPTHAAFAPILAMFDDLQERLDAVLTSGQRGANDR